MAQNLAIVTGTSRGIGLALAERLAEEGWSVVGLARGLAPIEHPGYRHWQVDLADPAALAAWVEEELRPILVQDGCGRVGLVNNAALIGSLGRVRDTDAAELARLLTVNTAAPIFLMGWLVKTLPAERTLRIVNISSGAAHSPLAGLGDYSSSKAGLRLAGKVLAAELEQDGWSPARSAVFSYEPGVVDTHMQDAARATDPEQFPSHATFLGFHDGGMLRSPQEVAGPVLDFLNSEPTEFFCESRFGATT